MRCFADGDAVSPKLNTNVNKVVGASLNLKGIA